MEPKEFAELIRPVVAWEKGSSLFTFHLPDQSTRDKLENMLERLMRISCGLKFTRKDKILEVRVNDKATSCDGFYNQSSAIALIAILGVEKVIEMLLELKPHQIKLKVAETLNLNLNQMTKGKPEDLDYDCQLKATIKVFWDISAVAPILQRIEPMLFKWYRLVLQDQIKTDMFPLKELIHSVTEFEAQIATSRQELEAIGAELRATLDVAKLLDEGELQFRHLEQLLADNFSDLVTKESFLGAESVCLQSEIRGADSLTGLNELAVKVDDLLSRVHQTLELQSILLEAFDVHAEAIESIFKQLDWIQRPISDRLPGK